MQKTQRLKIGTKHTTIAVLNHIRIVIVNDYVVQSNVSHEGDAKIARTKKSRFSHVCCAYGVCALHWNAISQRIWLWLRGICFVRIATFHHIECTYMNLCSAGENIIFIQAIRCSATHGKLKTNAAKESRPREKNYKFKPFQHFYCANC